MHYVTITQTRKIVVPISDDQATTAPQAVSFVAQEFADTSTAALSCDSDWDIVKLSFEVYTQYPPEHNRPL